MFLVIDVKGGTKGYINLGNDLSKAQDLLNMVENNLIFIKDNYNSFNKFTASCSVEVSKEIVLEKDVYDNKVDKIIISSELDNNYIGTLSEPIECEHNLKGVQDFYIKKLDKLNKELTAKNHTIQGLEDEVEHLKQRLDEEYV